MKIMKLPKIDTRNKGKAKIRNSTSGKNLKTKITVIILFSPQYRDIATLSFINYVISKVYLACQESRTPRCIDTDM